MSKTSVVCPVSLYRKSATAKENVVCHGSEHFDESKLFPGLRVCVVLKHESVLIAFLFALFIA
jgi:hypothetical protein